MAPKNKEDFHVCFATVINGFISPLYTIRLTKKSSDTMLATSRSCVGEKCLRDSEKAVATVDQSKTAPSPKSMAWLLLESLLIRFIPKPWFVGRRFSPWFQVAAVLKGQAYTR